MLEGLFKRKNYWVSLNANFCPVLIVLIRWRASSFCRPRVISSAYNSIVLSRPIPLRANFPLRANLPLRA